jgi:4'-phosphopantetheinyl transferase
MSENTIQIWHGEISAEEAYYQDFWRILDAAEQAHAGKLKNRLLHKRYVEIHGRLRGVLAKTLDLPPVKIAIKKTARGKPHLVDYPELAFNLSHSADKFIIALGWNCQLGVDIEICKPRINLAELVAKCFAEEEAFYWCKLPEEQKNREFYRFWTRKEAFVKATGHGIALGLNQCVINPEQPTEFLSVPEQCGPASAWHALDINLEKAVCSALVTDKTITTISLFEAE